MTENLSLLSLTLTSEVVKTRPPEGTGNSLYYPPPAISGPAPTTKPINSTIQRKWPNHKL
jgi:hypothetical protein